MITSPAGAVRASNASTRALASSAADGVGGFSNSLFVRNTSRSIVSIAPLLACLIGFRVVVEAHVAHRAALVRRAIAGGARGRRVEHDVGDEPTQPRDLLARGLEVGDVGPACH